MQPGLKESIAIRNKMIDAGVTWMFTYKTGTLSIVATGPNRSGFVVVNNIPDDVVLKRARLIIVDKFKRLFRVRSNAPITRLACEVGASEASV